jgi:hypothetical protein
LTAGLIEALGGTGALPSWISDARFATAGGSAGLAAPGAAKAARPAAPCTGIAPGPGGGGGRLITLLMTVVLWMLA